MDGASESQPDGAAGYVTRDLARILEALHGSDVLELDLQEGDVRLRLHRRPLPMTQEAMEESIDLASETFEGPQLVDVTAPLVGTFYRAEHPGAAPLASEGSRVEAESVVGIIEALQVLTEVEAGCSGTVVSVLATDGQPVQYGQTLFQVALDD
jgi:oxaloacetate decarboxylase alpha subunit